jgi:hypothetical protein
VSSVEEGAENMPTGLDARPAQDPSGRHVEETTPYNPAATVCPASENGTGSIASRDGRGVCRLARGAFCKRRVVRDVGSDGCRVEGVNDTTVLNILV